MSEQPEALRLAELCRSGALINNEWDEVADELTRLNSLEVKAASVEPVAYMTEDGRVSMRDTVETAMPRAARESFTIPLYAGVELGERAHGITPGAVPALVQLTEEQMISAVRPLCNTGQVAERLVAVSIDEYRAIEAAIAKINGLTVGDGGAKE